MENIMFLERLQNLMQENEINNLRQLALKTNIPYTTLRNYYDKKPNPTLEILNTLADFFEVTIDYLCGRVDDFGSYFETPPTNSIPTEASSPTQSETELLKKYRRLTDSDKEYFQHLIDILPDFKLHMEQLGLKFERQKHDNTQIKQFPQKNKDA